MMRNDAESETLLPCIPLDLRNATRDPEKHDEQNRQGCGVGDDGDPAPTLTKEFVHGVAHVPVCWDEEINAHEDISGTVTRGGDGGRHAGVAVPMAHSIRGTLASRSAASGGPNGTGVLAEKCWTLAATEAHCVQKGMAVRRLTPRECERLQGFPDDYTNIPGAADGPRYKALGNSMAVSVMRWIGKRIKEANDAR